MPLVQLDRFIYPENLLENYQEQIAPNYTWWVLYTKPRAEKEVARRFQERNLSFFLPLYQRRWRTKGRAFQSQLPLFPGYVFLYGDHDGREFALETNRLLRVITVNDQELLVSDLQQVYQMIANGVSLAPENRLESGMEVEIIHGPLRGLRGKVIRKENKLRFLVEVQFLRQGVSVEIEGWMLEKTIPSPRKG